MGKIVKTEAKTAVSTFKPGDIFWARRSRYYWSSRPSITFWKVVKASPRTVQLRTFPSIKPFENDPEKRLLTIPDPNGEEYGDTILCKLRFWNPYKPVVSVRGLDARPWDGNPVEGYY